MKIGAFATSLTDYNDVAGYKLLLKWCIVDATLLWLIPLLRIPRCALVYDDICLSHHAAVKIII